MTTQSIVVYFRILAVIATFLLWGICLLNGTVKGLLLAVWRGELDGTTTLKTNYTGVVFIDYPVALLVAFFYYGTNGQDEGYQLFLVDAYSTLQSAFVWLYIEAQRPGSKTSWVERLDFGPSNFLLSFLSALCINLTCYSRPIVFGLLWQCFGGAISLPLYYAYHILWADTHNVRPAQDAAMAQALPFSFLVGAILPAIIGMAPTWNGHDSRSSSAHQTVLAYWQPDPVWVSLIQSSLSATISFFHQKGYFASRVAAEEWTTISYALAGVSSAIGHIYAVSRVLNSSNASTNFIRMYIPYPFTGPEGVHNLMMGGPWLFLQYDLIVISLSSLSWAFFLLTRTTSGVGISKSSLCMLMAIGSFTVGPGATVSLALYMRERLLHKAKESYD
jgi:hypothetical protein